MEVKIYNFLSKLFRNKDFISQENPILADGKMMFFFQAEDGIRDSVASRGLGDVYKRQLFIYAFSEQRFYITRKPNLI